MTAYFDTSALIKLYYPEPESAALSEWAAEENQRIPFSLFHKTEIINAFALKLFRGEISGGQYSRVQSCIEHDRRGGVLEELNPDWTAVFQKAADIAGQHTPSLGARSLDIIHVALAAVSAYNRFVTFDRRQSELAAVCGLELITFEGA